MVEISVVFKNRERERERERERGSITYEMTSCPSLWDRNENYEKKKKNEEEEEERRKKERKDETSFRYESIWIPLIAENWKYCNKIIVKCINSTVRPIFKVVFTEKSTCRSCK